jgi:uncharacterized protein (TIGR03067 family)
MRSPSLLLLTTFLLLGASQPKDDAAKTDRDRMQGTWAVESAAKRGEALPKEKADRIKVIITADKIAIQDEDQGRSEEALFTLLPGKDPPAIDLTPSGTDRKAEGIYQLDGDTLKLCWSKPGGARPADFTTSREDNRILLVLRRAKP